jgi:glycosyltransferase involved in cell wall biosynthesis
MRRSRKPAAAASSSAKPGLVVFTPLPPMPTGIGDYAAELLPHLAAHYRCTVVIDDAAPEPHSPPGITLLRRAEYEAKEAQFAADTHLYMLGNNPDHIYLLPILARHPGVAVLHDPALHHLLDCATASLGDPDGYCAAIEADYGAPGRLLAEQWREHNLRDRQMLYEMPMLRHLLGPARHVIVHSRHAAQIALAQAPQTPLTIAPHQFCPPSRPADGAAVRTRLGIGAEEIVFLSLGFVSHIKRIDTAMRALARIASRLPPFRYVIAGELRPDELDVARLARSLGLSRQVLTTGYVAEADFFAMIDLADVVINLRHPVGGETSGTLIRALGSGACVVVVDDGPFAEVADGAAIKLAWGPGFEGALGDTLLRLAISPAMRASIGARAAEVTAARHSPARTIAAYRHAIDSAAASADRPWRSGCAHIYRPVQQPADAEAPLWARLDATPRLAPAGRVLAIGAAADRARLRSLGHALEIAPPGWRPADAEDCAYDLVFAHLSASDPLLDQPALLAALNRVLRFGGLLVLDLHGLDPRGHALASRLAGEAAFAASGWRVDLAAAAAPPTLAQGPDGDDQPEAETMVWRAVKVSAFIARLPATAA